MASTLNELFQVLERELPRETLDSMCNGHELDMIDYHMNVGMWLRNRWRSGDLLPVEFLPLHPIHMDDLSALVLDGFWCHLHRMHFSIDELVARHKDNTQRMLEYLYRKTSTEFIPREDL